MSESSIPKIPNLDLANYRFILNNPKTPEFYDEARTNLFKYVDENSKCAVLLILVVRSDTSISFNSDPTHNFFCSRTIRYGSTLPISDRRTQDSA
jgi:hypothetical protein